MVGGAVNDLLKRVSGNHVGVMDEDCPEVDEDESTKVELAVEREEEDEQVVGCGLQVSIKRVERIRSPRSGN